MALSITTGYGVVDVDEDKSVLAAEVTDFSRNVWGNVHGGFLYTMADTAAGCFCGPNTDTAT